MRSRASLQSELEDILGSRNVYFQPPESLKLSYPAIVYKRSRINNRFANNDVYNQYDSYEVTVIDKNPDSQIARDISLFPKTRFDRNFVSENLNHTVFTINY